VGHERPARDGADDQRMDLLMEKMPFQPRADTLLTLGSPTPVRVCAWQRGLPSLTGSLVTLRELRVSDAPALFAALTTEQVSRFISPPPSSVDGFERFIAWTHRQREAGQYICFAVVPKGSETAIGIFQLRSLEPAFGTAEWGFALAQEFWGSGVFVDGATLIVDYAVDVVGTHRLEARAALKNGRGNGALRKIGAVHEGVLRGSFLRNGEYLDQALWTILATEWRAAKTDCSAAVIH
jgi:ribosomal-protein-alanine N-acetyltransferase